MRWFWKPKPQSPDPPEQLLREIRRSFEDAAADEEHFPSTIDPRIRHVTLILETLPPAPTPATPVTHPAPSARYLDVGCGKGRFSRIVKDHPPAATVVAMDLAVAMLRCAAPDLARAAASMLQLPFASATFDAAWATESLEHAVDIERAVAEICRVLKPGAPLVIIDKNAEHWGRLETPAWEKWFHRDQLLKLLRRHCRSAECRPVSYWEDVPPDGLFLAWLARK